MGEALAEAKPGEVVACQLDAVGLEIQTYFDHAGQAS